MQLIIQYIRLLYEENSKAVEILGLYSADGLIEISSIMLQFSHLLFRLPAQSFSCPFKKITHNSELFKSQSSNITNHCIDQWGP